MACSLNTVNNHTNGFDFAELFLTYIYLSQTCPPESDIFSPGTQMLTNAVCQKITGGGWKAYPKSDVWNRLVVWKLPLFQLVAQFPRPPLGIRVEAATILHLLSDPIDSTASMMLTLAMCSSRVRLAKELCSNVGINPSDLEYHRTWKALALIMVSYDECGCHEMVDDFCRIYRELHEIVENKDNIREKYENVARSLASDRSTKTLPVVIAELIFIGGWLIALLRTASSDPNPSNWVNVEAHSIAISALYLWVTSVVVMGAVIGVSQTEQSIPRLLDVFEYPIADVSGNSVRWQSAVDCEKYEWCRTSTDRALHGGVFCWRPLKWRQIPTEFKIGYGDVAVYSLFSTFSVGMSFLTAVLLSYFVPPRGPNCRHILEALMFGVWLLSFAAEFCLERWLRRRLFAAVFCKDVFITLSNLAMMFVIQFGILSRCSCWSMWGLTGVALPQQPEVKPELMYFIQHIAPLIIGVSILLQLLFCGTVAWRYWDAVSVFVQRDDGV